MEQQLLFPIEISTLAERVNPEKRNQVQVILNQVFDGVSKIKAKIDSIVVSDENDFVGMEMARKARLAVRQIRLDAEKVFDGKRQEVQTLMLQYKTEDTLWLKAKQIMQAMTKEIEEIARYKEETRQRYEAKLREERIKMRTEQVHRFRPDIPVEDFANMSDESFEIWLKSIEKEHHEKLERERLEREREERLKREMQEKQKLYNERKAEISKYAFFTDVSKFKLSLDTTEEEYQNMITTCKKAKQEYEERQRKQAEELKAKLLAERERQERLKKEMEERQRKQQEELKAKLLAEKQKVEQELLKAKEAERQREQKIKEGNDFEKLNILIAQFEGIKYPEFESEAMKQTLVEVKRHVAAIFLLLNSRKNQLK